MRRNAGRLFANRIASIILKTKTEKKNKQVIYRPWSVRIDRGHSFFLYGPPGRQITYISSSHRVIFFLLYRKIYRSPFFTITVKERDGKYATRAPDIAGAPNDGFLSDYLKRCFRIWSAFKALKVHFRLRYNIFICSVILGEL